MNDRPRQELETDPRGDDLRRLDDLHRPDDRRDLAADDPGGRPPLDHRRRSGSSTATCSRSRRSSPSAGGSPTSPATAAWWSSARSSSPSASALCGATPTGSAAEAWLIFFRIIQGAGAAIMFPAALAIVLESFPVAERGRAMAIFFGIAGGLTSIGPIAGGYLTEWTWRSIFWINIPVAIIALFLTWKAKPADNRHPGKIDYKGTVLVCGGMGLLVLGLQQSAIWGWGDAKTWASIVIGVGILVWFVKDQLELAEPAAAPADLREPRLRRRQRRPLLPDDRLRAAVLLRQRVRADLARRIGLGNRALPADLLRRLRDRDPVGRQNARPHRGAAAGGPRLRDRRGRLLALGQAR